MVVVFKSSFRLIFRAPGTSKALLWTSMFSWEKKASRKCDRRDFQRTKSPGLAEDNYVPVALSPELGVSNSPSKITRPPGSIGSEP